MMSGKKSNTAHSIHDRLLNISRDKGENLVLLLKRFAYEGFLRRLQLSPYSRQFVLKGAFLLMQWTKEYYRSTKDVDMLVYENNQEERIREMIADICAIPFEQDGLNFVTSDMTIGEIREDEEYQGLQAKFKAYIGNIRIPLQIDMGFGDAVTPSAVEIEFSSLLGLPAPRILSYPVESVISEKVEAMVSRGLPNSRMKDFYDVYALIKTCDIDISTLHDAITATFDRRKTTIPTGIPVALTDEFATDELKKIQWRSFIKKNELSHAPEELGMVVEEIRKLVLPIFSEINQQTPGKLEIN